VNCNFDIKVLAGQMAEAQSESIIVWYEEEVSKFVSVNDLSNISPKQQTSGC
jgi:hypothetical protein